ncbi:hypothetical protein PG997_008820 [Apiospora hydei]|uniref:Uncharacterized protein n=1 Tax=Apiospora hydei TaxID=1337664 RepID=A0ABR1WBX7_9PEZI
MAYTMSVGTATPPPPQFTPAPSCRESFAHLYRVTSFAQESPTGAHLPACTTASEEYLWTCAYYNLGYHWRNGGESCVPRMATTRVDEVPPSYSGCPVGYTTACAGTNAQRNKDPYWPSTIVEAVCCPTHSVYSFTCDSPEKTSTVTDFPWYEYTYGSIGCAAAVPPAMTTAVDVLQVETVAVGTWLSWWTETNKVSTFTGADYQYDYDSLTTTSTATLTPGIDRVSAQAVHNHYTVWGHSTCYGRSGCATPAPMWDGSYYDQPADPRGPRQEAEARRRDLLYTDQSPESGST